MTTDARRDAAVERKADDGPAAWELRLYVAGSTKKSIQAIENLTTICEKWLHGRYRIDVIDLLEEPQLAADHQILAVPTLVRQLPEPVRRVIGDLSSEEHVLVGLDLRPVGG